MMIRHLVLEGSSECIFGRNVTRRSDILHNGMNCIRFTVPDGSHESIPLIDHDMHSYIPKAAFACTEKRHANVSGMSSGVLSSVSSKPIQECSWTTIKHTIEKVHRHLCGHSPYSDLKLLLIRNNFWNEAVERYLNEIVDKCAGCRHTSLPRGTRKVSLSYLSRSFN